MVRKIPHAAIGQNMTPEQRQAVELYSKTRKEFWFPGTVLTADMCNRAIDWYNAIWRNGD